MNTEQNYVGGGNYANPDPHTARNSIMPDSRQGTRGEKLRQFLDSAQTKLIEYVDDFFTANDSVTGPIKLINDLHYYWLTTPAKDLQITNNQKQIRKALDLVGFLAELYHHKENTFNFIVQLKEVSNG